MQFSAAAGPIALAAVLLACLGGGEADSAQDAEWTSCHSPAGAHRSILVYSRTAGMAGLAVGFQALGYLIMRQIVKIEV
jgi:hypothetical protein